MRKPLAFCRKALPAVISAFLAIWWSGIIAVAQSDDRPTGVRPPYGDAHVGGDVPIDERMAEARGGRASHNPPAENRVLKKGVLAPSRDDRTAFAAFLRMPNTGLIRLFPRESPPVPPKKRSFQTIPVCAACYSFANVTHFLGYGSDIELNSGSLSKVSALGYGLLTNLGDVPLEAVSLTDPRTTFIVAYQPAVTFPEARAETLRFRAAVAIDGVRYQDNLPANVDTTYLLRSINYGKPVFATKASVHSISSARRTDVLVAFRVVRKDGDGSVIIAWKLLRKYPDPKLK